MLVPALHPGTQDDMNIESMVMKQTLSFYFYVLELSRDAYMWARWHRSGRLRARPPADLACDADRGTFHVTLPAVKCNHGKIRNSTCASAVELDRFIGTINRRSCELTRRTLILDTPDKRCRTLYRNAFYGCCLRMLVFTEIVYGCLCFVEQGKQNITFRECVCTYL